VVAECLGKLTLIDPYSLLPNLQLSLSSSSALMRTTLLTAVKFTISDQPQPIDMLLRQNMDQFLSALTDPDINVRRVTLIAFNSAAHNKPSLVRDLLDTVLPKLYAETIVKVFIYILKLLFKNSIFTLFVCILERTYTRSRNGSI